MGTSCPFPPVCVLPMGTFPRQLCVDVLKELAARAPFVWGLSFKREMRALLRPRHLPKIWERVGSVLFGTCPHQTQP